MTLRRFAPLALLLAATLAACDEAPEGGAQAQGAAQPPPEVTVATPLVRRLTEWDELTGRFEAVQRVEIRARVSGYLQEIGFQDGQIVEAGQVLFVVDPRPYEAARDRIKATIADAEAQLKLAELEQGRTAQLVETSATARARLDQRNAELQAAEASLAAAQAQLRDAEL
ncbi:MAG TPA: efflux RND transporter periplasmic adaptor subunit, partial [Geminicoccaceae bacterium]|nr:efflux RND transporter periplasmic adaptor subunit [Geminicoccaceae bacterium]